MKSTRFHRVVLDKLWEVLREISSIPSRTRKVGSQSDVEFNWETNSESQPKPSRSILSFSSSGKLFSFSTPSFNENEWGALEWFWYLKTSCLSLIVLLFSNVWLVSKNTSIFLYGREAHKSFSTLKLYSLFSSKFLLTAFCFIHLRIKFLCRSFSAEWHRKNISL
jgi:hypothetical protein